MMKQGIYHELELTRLAISGALANPDIVKALAKVGYDRKEILRGQSRLTKFQQQQGVRETEENSQKVSTQRMRAAYQEANVRYMAHLKLARLVVPRPSQAWDDMKMSGQRRRDMAGWMAQAQAFYRHVGPVTDLLAQRGITAEELSQTQAMVAAVADARVEQNRHRGSKQVAKVRRDEERAALRQWMRGFMRAARFAFADDKQQLEALGIVVPS